MVYRRGRCSNKMATNFLTGDYQAVFQIAIRQINALLATLHQNGAASEAAMKLPHTARLSDPHRTPSSGCR